MQEKERKEKFLTDSDIEIKRVYNKINVADEQPGEFPPFSVGYQNEKHWSLSVASRYV